MDRPASFPALIPGEAAHAETRSGQAFDNAFATAQMMGQGGQRRGLRLGQWALRTARGIYLETEYSGPHDRRPEAGLLVRAAI